jgi:hypothetical protein
LVAATAAALRVEADGRALYLRQHGAQRHSTETPPLGKLRRVKRHPNEVLMSV